MRVIDYNKGEVENFIRLSLHKWEIQSSKILILGIKEGGQYLAENVIEIAKELSSNSIDIQFVKCQRPTTAIKKNMKIFREILNKLPVFLLNQLRVLEYYFLNNKYKKNYHRNIILDENIDFQQYEKIMIVDDAVDSGATLQKVYNFVKEKVSNNVDIKTLVVVSTSKTPIILPDYCLYKGVLLRFPWSMDSK